MGREEEMPVRDQAETSPLPNPSPKRAICVCVWGGVAKDTNVLAKPVVLPSAAQDESKTLQNDRYSHPFDCEEYKVFLTLIAIWRNLQKQQVLISFDLTVLNTILKFQPTDTITHVTAKLYDKKIYLALFYLCVHVLHMSAEPTAPEEGIRFLELELHPFHMGARK